MSSGDIQWSGRAVRWLFWRAPRGAARYNFQSNMALASDIGRRVTVFLVYGAYLWGLRWLAEHVVRTKWTLVITAVLLLLWFWHGINLVQWIVHARAQAAQARAMQRQLSQNVQELRSDVREAISAGMGRATGGLYTVAGMGRQHDPEYAAQQQQARKDAEEALEQLGPEQAGYSTPAYGPILQMPKWIRKRRPR